MDGVTEPTTEAGKRLLKWTAETERAGYFRQAVLDIETEAAAAALAALRVEVEGLEVFRLTHAYDFLRDDVLRLIDALAPHDAPALDRDRLASIRDLLANYLWNEDDSGNENDLEEAHDELRDYLAALGDVRLPETGLRKAAQRLLRRLDEPVLDGQRVVGRADDVVVRLRAALSVPATGPEPETGLREAVRYGYERGWADGSMGLPERDDLAVTLYFENDHGPSRAATGPECPYCAAWHAIGHNEANAAEHDALAALRAPR